MAERMPSSGAMASMEDIVDDAGRGEPCVLVDSDDEDAEGSILWPAAFADAAAISFMATHARGLICLAITAQRAGELRLELMAPRAPSSEGRPFTVSIEAREGVTTGISAHDRARTIQVAIAADSLPSDLVSPGHVFPMVARDGGVLARADHVEAAVDIARLAGLAPAGVVCGVLNADGSTARLRDLRGFAARHGLRIGSIADLIEYRRRLECQVEEVRRGPFKSLYGDFTMHVFRNRIDDTEHVALTRGRIGPGMPTLVRMHQVDMATDLLAHAEARQAYLPSAMRMIANQEGPAALVLVRDPDQDWLSRRMAGMQDKAAKQMALRDYGVGAQILLALGVRDMILLSSSRVKLAALAGYGLNIVERRPIQTIL
ncbi:GTP cyclohydrolase II [Sphingobium indicum UT26S]|uniref:3,4-dihydroxy-2-butanone 4-phosphate synthase n=3 Tax=Sphingobium TaxID=165695 RepID=D4Z8C7_SPHIU|nr:GTP cyclohydrolase II [Sphingobium indicum UT26S]